MHLCMIFSPLPLASVFSGLYESQLRRAPTLLKANNREDVGFNIWWVCREYIPTHFSKSFPVLCCGPELLSGRHKPTPQICISAVHVRSQRRTRDLRENKKCWWKKMKAASRWWDEQKSKTHSEAKQPDERKKKAKQKKKTPKQILATSVLWTHRRHFII